MIVKTDREIIQSYLIDASNYKSSGCDAVYVPESYEELSDLLIEANHKKIPVTISGAGTGLVGGRVPQGGIIISLEKFDQILSFDKKNKKVRVQASVTLAKLQEYLNEFNLFYPPDPTERNCSIGGTAATNASGARTLKYGPTRNWITSLKFVFANGEILNLSRGQIIAKKLKFEFSINSKDYKIYLPILKMPDVKNAAGYYIKPDMDLIDLFIGSEGTLGVILELELNLLEKPKDVISMVIFFETFESAYKFVCEARSKNKSEKYLHIDPRSLEFFDDKSLEFLSDKFPNVRNKKFAIWFEQETNSMNSEKILEELSNLIVECDGDLNNIWYAANEKDINEIKEFRHSISLLVNEYIARNDLRKVGTDIAVPSKYFEEFYKYCRSTCEDNNLKFVGYGHIGNDHLHFNMLPKDKVQNELAMKLYREFCEKAVKLGGTVSAEHGIGKLKREYFALMYPEEILQQMFEIKRTLDPNLILNYGNIFPERFYEKYRPIKSNSPFR